MKTRLTNFLYLMFFIPYCKCTMYTPETFRNKTYNDNLLTTFFKIKNKLQKLLYSLSLLYLGHKVIEKRK